MSSTQSKIILIGQAPSRFGDPSQPLCMAMAKRLSSLIGISYLEYMDSFDRMNVLDYWPGASEKGDKFPMREARKSAMQIIPTLSRRKVIFVGKGVAHAFSFPYGYFRWKLFYDFAAAAIPHPSGVNYWWNDEINVARAKKFLGSIVERVA